MLAILHQNHDGCSRVFREHLRNSINSGRGGPTQKRGNIHKMNGTPAGTPAGTPTKTPAETPDDNEYLPPCRQAGFFIAPCPRCGRELTLKTLRYTHICGRSFDPEQRARELQAAAEKASNARTASWEQSAERRMQQPAEHTQPNLDKKTKYASLLKFQTLIF